MNTDIWNAIYVASRQEKKVAQRLSDKSIENYLPLIKVMSQWSDRKKMVEKPLFNSYVFVKELANYEDVLKTQGVVGFLKYNGKNAIVRQSEIDTIVSLINYGYDIAAFNETKNIEIGQKVMVTDGPLKGNIGELLKRHDGEWFIISFESIGTSIQVKLLHKLLKPIA